MTLQFGVPGSTPAARVLVAVRMHLPIGRTLPWPIVGPTPTCSRSRNGTLLASLGLTFPLVSGAVLPSLAAVATPVAILFVVLLFAAAVRWYTQSISQSQLESSQ